MTAFSINRLFLYFSVFLLTIFISSCSTPEPEKDPTNWDPSEEVLSKKDQLVDLDLSEQGYKKISPSIGDFSNLEKLYLEDNELTNLPVTINQLENVRFLNLANNNFSEFPSEVIKMKSLKELDIRHNPISKLPEEVSKMEKLNTIYIGGTNIDEATRSEIRKLLPRVKVIAGNSKK